MKRSRQSKPVQEFMNSCQDISNTLECEVKLITPEGEKTLTKPETKSIRDPEESSHNPSNDSIQDLEKILPLVEQTNVSLGELFSRIKHSKGYVYHGYNSFKDYLEYEHKFSSSLAAKLISVYDTFYVNLDLPPSTLEVIGFERLSIIQGIVRKMVYSDAIQWIEKASSLPITDLRTEVKEYKKSLVPPDLQNIFLDQVKEQLTAHLNCEAKELQFLLHLFIYKRYLEVPDKDSLYLFRDELKKYRKWFQEKSDQNTANQTTDQEGTDGYENR